MRKTRNILPNHRLFVTRSAHMQVIEITHNSYLPAAEMLPAVGNARPQAKPDSFMIIVVGQ